MTRRPIVTDERMNHAPQRLTEGPALSEVWNDDGSEETRRSAIVGVSRWLDML